MRQGNPFRIMFAAGAIVLVVGLVVQWCPTTNLKLAYGRTTSVSVSPSTLEVGSPSTELPIDFNVNITVDSVNDLYGWQVNLTFDPTIVQVTAAFLPPNNVFADKDPITPSALLDNAEGKLFLGANIGPLQTTFSGSGILCTVTFEAIAPGTSPLTLVTKGSKYDLLTFLYGPYFTEIEPVDFFDGNVTVVPEFHSLLLVMLIMVATTAIVLFRKRLLPNRR